MATHRLAHSATQYAHSATQYVEPGQQLTRGGGVGGAAPSDPERVGNKHINCSRGGIRERKTSLKMAAFVHRHKKMMLDASSKKKKMDPQAHFVKANVAKIIQEKLVSTGKKKTLFLLYSCCENTISSSDENVVTLGYSRLKSVAAVCQCDILEIESG